MSLIAVSRTKYFDRWFNKLKDKKTRGIIADNIDRMKSGNFGTIRFVGDGVYEKKINYAGGFRLYYVQRGDTWILLLCGGNKSTQSADITLAKQLKKGLK